MFNFFKTSTAAYHNLPAAEFAAGLKKPGAVLLDVRTPAEFAEGHLPGAVNLDVSSPTFAQRVSALDKTQPTYVYCRSGARSATASAQLSGGSFENVFNLLGGVMSWPEKLVR